MRVTDAVVCSVEQTRDALRMLRDGGSWRGLSKQLGIPHSVLHAIGTGATEHVSWEMHDKVRTAIGLEPIEPTITAACPTCHGIHEIGDCKGKSIAQVVGLSADERVTKAGKPRTRKKYHRPCMDDAEYAEWLAWKAQKGRDA